MKIQAQLSDHHRSRLLKSLLFLKDGCQGHVFHLCYFGTVKAEKHRTRNRIKLPQKRTFGGFVCTRINKLYCHCYFIKLLIRDELIFFVRCVSASKGPFTETIFAAIFILLMHGIKWIDLQMYQTICAQLYKDWFPIFLRTGTDRKVSIVL